MPAKPVICLVTPGTRDANNGNWRTAVRWARMLRAHYQVIVQSEWCGERADVLIALHAKRSASSISAFHASGRKSLGVVLTGTDLYRDLAGGGSTAESLDLARRIVVLQEDAPRLLRPAWRNKCDVIFQSARTLQNRSKGGAILSCTVVGHLRAEKDPLLIIAALREMRPEVALRVRHIGAALDEGLGRKARAFAARDRRYRYLGALPHGLTRIAIASSDLLVHPSIMEGGANVIVEAVTSGTAILASDISGNAGMMGADYPGYFPVGDAGALAAMLRQCATNEGTLARLRAACRARKTLFAPRAEARAITRFVAKLLA